MITKKTIKKLIPLPIVLGVMTSIVTLVRIEEHQSFFRNWLPFYFAALLIIAPIGILVLKTINTLLEKCLSTNKQIIKDAILGISMASVVGSLMTITSIYIIKEFDTFTDFISLVKSSLKNALPFMVVIGAFVGSVIKPLLLKPKKV